MSDEYGIGRHVANLFVTQTYEVFASFLIPGLCADDRLGAKRHTQLNPGQSNHWHTSLRVSKTWGQCTYINNWRVAKT